ncbi:helix-turn-helix transcriptional regulator [Pseudonocardia kongjuensis]|uniref:helix-turn-helix domain-containing protein n=1 Tax=Pseudonocardia kongjuensis TaxID=102227 RepID=UPI0031D4D417
MNRPADDDRPPEDPRPPTPVGVVPDVSGIVRSVRRRADLSQRELAERTGLSPATIGRIESRSLVPALTTLAAILAVGGIRLVAVDEENRRVTPMEDPSGDELRDGAGRRFPSHLDVILDPEPGEWWADRYGFARPPETFRRDRTMRDVMRRRSVWEVRVKDYQWADPPPTIERWIQLQARCEQCGRIPPPVPPPFTVERVHRYLDAAARIASAQVAGTRVAGRTHGGAPRPSPDR